MHNIKLLRENINDFKKKLSNRNFDFNVKEFEDLDKYNRKLINQREKLEQEKKYYLNLRINQILKSLKAYQKRLQSYQVNRLTFKIN